MYNDIFIVHSHFPVRIVCLFNAFLIDGKVISKVKIYFFSDCQTFDGHSDYVNDLVFAPREGQEVASVSDDHTCRYVFCSRHH